MVQVVIVPIVKKDADADSVLKASRGLHASAVGAGIRCKLDERLDQSPGFKYNDYELRVGSACCITPSYFLSQVDNALGW